MLDNDRQIIKLLFTILQSYCNRRRGRFFLRLLVKNVMRLNIPATEIESANVSSSYSRKDRSAVINILTEYDYISLCFSFRDIAKDWRMSHYSKLINSDWSDWSDWYELLDERNVTFFKIKDWLLDCKSDPENGNYFLILWLLSLMETSASHPFVKHILIKLYDLFSCIPALNWRREIDSCQKI